MSRDSGLRIVGVAGFTCCLLVEIAKRNENEMESGCMRISGFACRLESIFSKITKGLLNPKGSRTQIMWF